jgi:UDP-2,3-diacylglucosamine pyrophosphatase LpxH
LSSVKPIIVLSDLHFGEDDATLGVGPSTSPESEERVNVLADQLEALGPLDELVLLGDIFELWTASFARAHREAACFLARMGSLPLERIVYLPGNHDHHLLIEHIELEDAARVRRGEAPQREYLPHRQYADSFLEGLLPPAARDKLVVKYPDHVRTFNGKRLVFHHGHHLATLRGGDLFSTGPLFIIERLEGVGLSLLTRKELEKGSTIFYEMMYSAALGEGTRTRMNEIWDWIQFRQRDWRALRRLVLRRLGFPSSENVRGTERMDIECFEGPARWLFRLMAEEGSLEGAPDCYIFGHTHRSGIYRIPASETEGSPAFYLVNSGCWLVEPAKENREHVNTLVVIGEEVGIYRLEGGELRLKDSVPLG